MKDEKTLRSQAEEFPNIKALLALIDYRMEDAAGNLQYGLSRLFLHDTLYGKKAATRALAGLLTPVLWLLSKARNRAVKKADPRLAFSNTFLQSSRYAKTREAVEKATGCTAILTFTDLLKRENPDQQINLKASLKPERHNVRPIYFRGAGIIGGKLQKAVIRYCELKFASKETSDAEIEKALQHLETAYRNRLSRVTDCLRREGCALYLTVNQYNMRDLLIIYACHELGIRTFQQEHHATQFNREVYDENHPVTRLSFVGEYGFWSKSEQLFHEKVYHYESFFYRPEEIRFRVTGNPEMDREDAEKTRRQYPPERKLTLMLASMQDYELEGKRDAYEQWRMDIFRGLKELSEKQRIVVNIRYTPNKELDLRKKEAPILKAFGFRISESVPANLMEDLCSSVAIMSSTSSVLSTARLFGKMVFRVQDWEPEYSYVHVDDEFHEVTPEDIPNILIPEGLENTVPEIDPEGIFDINRIK